MARKSELADYARPLRARLHAGERDALVHRVAFDAIKSPQEIKVPPRTTEFTVGDRLQADLLLLADDTLDFAVFDGGQIGRGNLALGATRAHLLEGGGAQ